MMRWMSTATAALISQQLPTDYLLGIIFGMVGYGVFFALVNRRLMKRVEQLEKQVRQASIDLALCQDQEGRNGPCGAG